jgi:hypothetical protein
MEIARKAYTDFHFPVDYVPNLLVGLVRSEIGMKKDATNYSTHDAADNDTDSRN